MFHSALSLVRNTLSHSNMSTVYPAHIDAAIFCVKGILCNAIHHVKLIVERGLWRNTCIKIASLLKKLSTVCQTFVTRPFIALHPKEG